MPLLGFVTQEPAVGTWPEREVCIFVGKDVRRMISGDAVGVHATAIGVCGVSFACIVGCCRG